jgi:hypothetical protein
MEYNFEVHIIPQLMQAPLALGMVELIYLYLELLLLG